VLSVLPTITLLASTGIFNAIIQKNLLFQLFLKKQAPSERKHVRNDELPIPDEIFEDANHPL
jgi:hypothetical protein